MQQLQKPVTFSVVIPLYNKERSVLRAMQSVLAQQCNDFELIVVDDGSTDGSWQCCHQLTDDRIVRLQQPNQGVSVARNTGAAAARGRYLCFLDADDAYHPDFLQILAGLIACQPNAALYSCRYVLVTETGQQVLYVCDYPTEFRGEIKDFFSAYQQNRSLIHSSSAAIPATLFHRLGGFPPGVTIGEDIFLWLQASLTGPMMFCAKPASTVYQDAENRTIHQTRQALAWHSVYFLRDRQWATGVAAWQVAALDRFIYRNTVVAALGALRFGRRQVCRDYARLFWRQYRLTAVLLWGASLLPTKVFQLVKSFRDKRTAEPNVGREL
jgi:glycosyltransferase involved in cell wall biosynthesis